MTTISHILADNKINSDDDLELLDVISDVAGNDDVSDFLELDIHEIYERPTIAGTSTNV